MSGPARAGLRPLTEGDAPALGRVLSDPEVMRWLEPPFTPAQTLDFIRRFGMREPPAVLAVVWNATGEVVGHAIYHPFDAPDDYEIGWALRRDLWGRGLATELTGLLEARARRDGLRRLTLECVPGQAATIRVAEKCGFVPAAPAPEGLLRFVKAL